MSEETPEPIDVVNRQLVGCDGSGDISIIMPRSVMSNHEALVHAAWIVALADPLGEKFPAVLEAVNRT